MTRKVLLAVLEIVVPAGLIVFVGWWTAQAGSFFFPPLSDVASAFRDTWLSDSFRSDAIPSIYRLALGYTLAVILGVTTGTIIGLSRRTRLMTRPVIEFLRALPAPAAIPFFILVFGIGDLSKILLIALVTIWPVLLNTVDGISSIDETLTQTARMYNIRRLDRLIRVRLPAASPQIFAGMRSSLSLAIILMVVSEMVASTNGVGRSVLEAQGLFDISRMWAGIVFLGILGYVANLLFEIPERRLLRWHFKATERS